MTIDTIDPAPPRHPHGRLWQRNAALILPLLLVNAAAVYGQAGWAHDHISAVWILDALFAASVESIGIYLAAEAHAALMAGDASARLRIGSYLVGALVGTLNFAHFASPGYRPNPVALTFGLLSSISPWLWAIRSRSLNRDRLRELGQVDPRAVRFSILRWALFPVRTGRAFRAAVWAGIVQPAEAVALADAARASRKSTPSRPAAPVVRAAERTRKPRLDTPTDTLADAVSDALNITPGRTPQTRTKTRPKRSTRGRTDADLIATLERLARTGEPLSVRGVSRELNIGAPRARKLLGHIGVVEDDPAAHINGHAFNASTPATL